MTKTVEVTDNSPLLALSECKRTEERLRGSENRYRLVAENAADAIWTVNINMQPTYFSPSIARLLGYSVEEAMAKSMDEVFTPDSFELAMKVLTEELAIEKAGQKDPSRSRTLEFELKRKDGSIVPVEIKYSFLRGTDGQPVEILAIARDITERKGARRQVERVAQEWRTTFDAISDWISICDRDCKIVRVNKAFASAFGMKPQEILGRTCYELVHGTKEPRPDCPLRQALATGEPSRREFFEPHLGIHVEVACSPIFDEKGEVATTVHIVRDVTERKRVEEALQESEERFRDLFENANDLIQSVAPDGHFLYVNKAWREKLGYDEQEVANLTLWDIICPDFIPHCRELFQRVMSGEILDNIEVVFLAKDGRQIAVEGNANCRSLGGEMVASRGIFRDVTERKQVEEEVLAKSRQLEAASRAKSEFLAHMSHELRTPLNVIIGFTELMLDGVTGRLKKEQRQCLNDVLNSGRHLLGLISDVLDLSKIESGKMELRMKNIDLPGIIESLRSQIMPVIRPRKQKLELDVERDLPLVYADKSKVRQVLLNLLSNATKFTPDGGKLKIEAVSEDGWCRVSVIDSGTGIKEDDQKKIFEPFSQLDNSSLARVESGTGLGLPITRQIVDRHGGRIWVESECGKGSSFIFTLPLATPGQPHPRRRNKAAGEGGNGR